MAPLCYVNVIVVGGGAAGLAAAAAAEAAGLTCQLLEAQTQLGGRVRTVTLPSGTVFDEGAQMVNGDMRGVLDLAKSAGVQISPVPQQGIGVIVTGERRLRFEDMPSLDAVFDGLEDRTLFYGRIIDVLRALRRAQKDGAMPWDTVLAVGRALGVLPYKEKLPRDSLAAALRALALSPDEHALAHSVFAEIFGRPSTEIDAQAVVDIYLRYASERDDLEFQMAGGMSRIIDALAATLKHTPRLGAPVRKIAESEDGVTVSTDTTTWPADHVVVAVPPPVARNITFEVDDADTLDESLAAFASGDLIKTVLVYGDAFWRLKGQSGSAVFADPAGLATVDGSPCDGGLPCLIAFQGGPAAREWAALPAVGRKTLLLQHLCRAFGEEALAPVEVGEAVWVDHPWCGGGYNALIRTGAGADKVAKLAGRGGRVRFAGAEIDDHFQGYVEGALHSGRRAVARLVGEVSSAPAQPRPAPSAGPSWALG